MRGMNQRLAWLLLAPLAWLCGCGGPGLPPGGKPAVEYWHRVLSQHPDLPAKVEAIVESLGWTPSRSYDLPATEVRVYGEHGEVSLSGSKIELILTDLDTPALRELLAVWKAIPEQAAELGLYADAYNAASPKRKIIVLGSDGRVDIRAAGEFDTQKIHVLNDEVATQTRIGIHTFGPSGELALDELARCYQAVRGPPAEDVRSGYVSLPPPDDDTLSVLVIGKLQELNIEGAWGNSVQEVSVASYLSGHDAADDLNGKPLGSPFAERIAMHAAAARQAEQELARPGDASPAADAAAPGDGTAALPGPTGGFTPPQVVTPVQPPTFQPPTYTPPRFTPPVYVPPPVFHPPTTFTPPVRFH